VPLPSDILASKFPYEPTSGQSELFLEVDKFLDAEEEPVLLIKGYAGTGKTTVISALTKVLPLFNHKFVLMAPTGRAAKVMSSYAKRMAFTIHKKIYKQTATDGGGPKFKRQKNYSKNTVFIVDESSMINEEAGAVGKSLLSDLFNYVFSNKSNRIILIGDNAQLPPVGQSSSPALDKNHIAFNFSASVFETFLTEVTRQAQNSGILKNATSLRNQLFSKKPEIVINTDNSPDIFRMTGEKMEDGLRYAYEKYGIENTVIICRSNKAANMYNQYIRARIHFYESELEAGELLMIVRNNYLYAPREGDFLANGDFVEVQKIVSFEEMYGLRFATLSVKLVDYPNEPAFEAKVILDTLYSESPALTIDQNKVLYNLVREDYADLSSLKERREAIKNDPYLNALQIKFAYALTCHKSQGGQWPVVFVDQGFIDLENIDKDYLRWLYTAVTRATDQLFMVNFDKSFFK